MLACLILFLLFSKNRTLKAVVLLFVSNLSQFFVFAGKFIYFHSYWSMNGLIVTIPYKSFLLFSLFTATVTTYWKNLLSLFCGFLVAFVSLIRLGDFMYYPPPTMSTYFITFIIKIYWHNQKQIHCLSLTFLRIFDT